MSNPSHQDIPAAQRQSAVTRPAVESKRRRHPGKALGLLSLIAIASLCVWQWEFISGQTVKQTQQVKSALAEPTSSTTPQPTITDPIPIKPAASPSSVSANPTAKPTAKPTDEPAKPAEPNQLLNHRRYAEADISKLVALNPNSDIKLQPPVQIAVNQMIAQAKSEGVQLGIASGFRSIEDQSHLFFDVKAERGENSTTRAEVSAPPGYSEHHTGYAVDLIDESRPGTHTEASFETTPAYRWLKQNAPAYNFELSFPKDPNSPVGYEPWHWRYVGDRNSLELFYQEQAPTP